MHLDIYTGLHVTFKSVQTGLFVAMQGASKLMYTAAMQPRRLTVAILLVLSILGVFFGLILTR
jgi:hypothetical protein